MKKLVGIDGCRGGWVIATANKRIGPVRFDIVEDLSVVFQTAEREGSVVAIDIPIGLPDSGPRACDREARRVLEKHHSRVFPAPTRSALTGCSYAECCDLNEKASGVRLSKQSHAIIPKICGVATTTSGGR